MTKKTRYIVSHHINNQLGESVMDNQSYRESIGNDNKPASKKSSLSSLHEIISPEELTEEEELSGNALQKGAMVKERYKVIKTINEKHNRNVYKVEDTLQKNRILILKEFITTNVDKEEYKKRRDAFRDTIRIMSTFSHSNLVVVHEAFTENYRDYFLMEEVEGLPITKLAEMNAKPFSEKEVLNWGQQLCEAVEFMHYRPKPFTLGDIKPRHIMVDSEGRVRITGYDMQRFFEREWTSEFAPDDPKKLYNDVTKIARILYYLLMKTPYDENTLMIEWSPHIRPKMKKLLEKACREGQKSYGDIREFMKDLKDTPIEDNPEAIRQRFNFPSHKIEFNWIKKGFKKIASQHPFLISLEVVFVLFLVFVFTAMHLREIYSRPNVPIIYISSAQKLFLFNGDDNELIQRVPMNRDISFIFPLSVGHKDRSEKRRILLIGSKLSSEFEVLNSQNLKLLKSFTVEKHPISGVLNSAGDTLYTVHPSLDVISVINSDELQLMRLFPTGKKPEDIIYLEGSFESQVNADSDDVFEMEEREDTQDVVEGDFLMGGADSDSSNGTLVVSNSASHDIIFLDAKTGRMKKQILIEGSPGAMAYIKNRKEIIFADKMYNRLGVLNLESMEVTEYIDLPGNNPSAMALDNRNKLLWIALRDSNGLALLDTENKSFVDFSKMDEELSKTDSSRSMTMKTGLGQGHQGLYIDEESRKLYVLNEVSKNMVVLNLDNHNIIKRIDFEQTPMSFSIEP